MKKAIFILFLLPITVLGQLSTEEQKLLTLLNEYRVSKGLPEVKVSEKLMKVARAHTKDLNKYAHKIKKGCNAHSWSKHGSWKPVDYHGHEDIDGVKEKGMEIANYKGYCYENVAWRTDSISAIQAFNWWKQSKGHNDTMLQKGGWKGTKWAVVGVSIENHYACIWFGEIAD